MDVREGETVEFKREMNSGAVKTVIAFANTGGGTLYIGVDDEGVPVGVDDIDAEMTRVTSRLRGLGQARHPHDGIRRAGGDRWA